MAQIQSCRELGVLLAIITERRAQVFAVGSGRTCGRILVDAGDGHLVAELHLTGTHQPGDRRGKKQVRKLPPAGYALISEHSRSRVKADPPCAWYVRFGPGMQVAHILFRPGEPSGSFTSGLSWIK